MSERTEICHSHPNPYNECNGWKFLCNGHGDSRLSGGMYFYRGNKEEALRMAQERIKYWTAQANVYYANYR